MEDNYSKLYKAMVNSGYDTADLGGSEDDFRREMQDSTTRKNFYDWVSNNEMNGFRIGSYDAYEERLAPNEATVPQAVTAPQQGFFDKVKGGIADAAKQAMQKPRGGENGYTFTAEELGVDERNGDVARRTVWGEESIATVKLPEIKPINVKLSERQLKELRELPEPERNEAVESGSFLTDEHKKAREEFDKGLTPIQRMQMKDGSLSALNAPDIPKNLKYDYDFRKEFGYFPGGSDTEFWNFLKTKTGEEYQMKMFGRPLSDYEIAKLSEDARRLGFWGTVGQGFKGLGYGLKGVELELAEWIADLFDVEHAKENINEERERILTAQDNFKPTAEGVGGFVAEMIPQMTGTGLGLLVSAVNPVAGAAIVNASTAAQVASSMGSTALEARRAGASDAQTAIAMLLSGGAELLSEKYVNSKYIKRIMPKAADVVAEAGDKALESELNKLLQTARKELGGKFTAKTAKDLVGDMFVEGASEFSAEAVQALIPIVYEHKEDFPNIVEVFNAGLEGFAGGVFMGGIFSGTSSLIQSRANNRRRREQGFVDVANVEIGGKPTFVEVLGKDKNGNFVVLNGDETVAIKESQIKERKRFDYNDFRNAEVEYAREIGYEQEPTGENAVKEANEYTNARNEVVKVLSLAEGADVDAMLEGRTAEEIAMGDSEVEDAVNNYIKARARRDGFRERYQEERDRQFAKNDQSIDERTNNGTVYGVATENGEAFITSGTVVLNEEGEIDYANSEDLVVMFPDGTKKPVQRDSLPGKVTVQNAEDLKAAGRTAIEERWRAEFESAENAYVEQQKRTEGVVFDVTDKEGVHRVEVVKEGEEISNVLVDGEAVQISTEMLNALRGEAGVTQAENGTEGRRPEGLKANVEGENGVVPSENQSTVPTAEEVADAQAFADAYAANTVEAYQNYLDNHPEGAYREGARNGIWTLEGTGVADVASITNAENVLKRALAAEAESKRVADEAQQPQVVAPKVAEVPDFFRMDGKNYAVVSRNKDGSVTVVVDGKRAVLPAETNFTAAVLTDKGGKVLFTEMPAEKTLEYFVQRVPNGQARAQMIENNRKQAESALKKFDKEPNVGTDPDAYEAAMNKWEADKKAAQAKVDYWNEVAKRDTEISQSEMRESVEAVKPREVVEMTPEEFVANQLGGIKITPESFQKETGTKAEQKQMVGVIAGKEKGGVSIERAAEIIYENYGDELRGLGFNGDMQDVRDMIIDVLSNGNPRSFAKNGLEMRQQADVEQQLAELRGVANALNFESIEEQIAYEESIVPRIMQELKGFDETEYFNNLAENYENDTTRESENTRGSSELLQGEQSTDNAGATDLGEPGQGGEVQGDVYSGGENAAPQGNQQVSSPEIPNNQNRDNVSPVEGAAESGNAPGMKRIPTTLQEIDNAVVEETQAPVVESAPVAEVETPQATNEMQEADLTEDVKTEDVNETTLSQPSEQVGDQVAEGGNAPGQSGVQQNESGKMYSPEELEKIEDVGEVLAGARKDELKVIASSFENATVKSLIELPFSKAFKKPDLKKAVESGALREEDALFYEAMFNALINSSKPKNSARHRNAVETWAEETYNSLQLIKSFVEADEAARDRAMADALADKYPTREEELAVIEKRKVWNARNNAEWGDKTTPNPVWVAHEVLKALGYKPGDKVEIPFGVLKANVFATGYEFYNKKGDRLIMQSVPTVEEGIENIVWLSKIKRGDADTMHPVSSFFATPTKRDMGDSGRYYVLYGTVRNPRRSEFGSIEEANAFAANHKEAVVRPIQEVVKRYGYKIAFRNPLTGDKFYVNDMEFETEGEAMQYLDENYDAVNEQTNELLAKERGEAKKEVSADDLLEVAMVRGKEGWKYAVNIKGKYANNMGMPLLLREFDTREDAKAFLNESKNEVFEVYKKQQAEQKKFVFFDTGENSRIGEDYRGGRDVTAQDFMDTFGFRGVQFGNWTNQEDRQMAVNQAFDAFLDLAKLLGVSPKALSLNGELGMAFGSRGSGFGNAHYEPGEIVINLTKTRGAGSLAHEWWHALDNYFARRANVPMGMVTDSRSIDMRPELRQAYNDLLKMIEESDFYKRSKARGDYWGRMHEVTARLMAEWVDQSLKDRGELNTFLSRGVNEERYKRMNYDVHRAVALIKGKEPLSYEEFEKTPEALAGFPYPSRAELKEFGDAMRNIFETVEEQETEEGDVVLYRSSEDTEGVNEKFNEQLDSLTEENADTVELSLGTPSPILKAAGVMDMPMKLYGSKVIKKMKKHGFKLEELKDLPNAVADPIAVFNNHNKEGNRAILTELMTADGNFLVTIDLGDGTDIDFNIVSSVFGKSDNKIVHWFNKGFATYINKEKALDYLHLSAPIAEASDKPELSSATKIVENFENPTVESKNLTREGAGPLTDREVVMESDVYSKVLGKPRYYGKRQREFVARQRRRMADKARQVAEKLNLDNVEVLESTEGLTGKKATSKGWFDPRTGKITVVVPNHGSTGDIVETVLHEAVAHYGLRKLFGENFKNFLDNVYRNVTPEIRAEINELAKAHDWDLHVATEEYLASLAENTNFERVNPSVWSNIKSFFMKMLAKVGITLDEPLGDNELRYILWRSHQNLVNPGWFNVFGQVEDIAKQYELGVGNYASGEVETENGDIAAEDDSALLHREGGAPGSARERYELTPEQKKKQKALKENAKAIRRLHNVKANYPITALRNLGFALETQEQREMHDRLFAERDAISGRENAVSVEVNPQAMTLQERITVNLLKMAEQNKDNVELRLSAIRAYGRDLANVIKLMRAQRGYDRNTVNMFVSLAKMYLRNNAMSGMSSYDISRLLGLISRANGGYGPQVMRAAEQIAEIITKSHTRELEDIVRKQIKTGAEKVNASGVVVQGGVDVVGKRVLNTFRDAINMTSEEEFEKAFREEFEKAAKFPNDEEAKAACDAMVIAKEYRDNIIEAKKQESELLKSINQYSDIRSRYDRGEITRREYNEFVDAVRKSLIELRSRMVDDYQRIIHALGGDISEGIKRAKEFRERELARVEKIHNMAEADMSDVSKSAERKKRGFWRKATDYVVFKNPLSKVIAEGLGTYNEFMKFFGRNAIGGKGRLYDYFIGRYTEVQNQEWVEKQKDIKKIDERCEMVFGKGFMDVMRDSEKNTGVVLEYWNGGERVSRDLSIGQLMYIYMTAKQTDGEMKLRGMGITEETVNKAVAVLPARYKVFADWVQSVFLPEMRPRLNEVHKRMFGASMSEVKNYFPLVVNTDARQAEVDLNSVMPITPSTITGSIIKRKVNATPLNLESNAFDVLLKHVSDMEHWAAFAEFTRDNNTLIGDKDFMNRVKNSRDLRFGDGEAIWDNFVETARITTGNYRAKKDEWANVMKGVSSAKITFGYYTALKQLLSAPGMWLEAGAASIIKATVNPLGSWRWAIENLPGFEERWKSRTAGNERLADSDTDWSIWDNRVVKAAREAGMAPNAFIDAVVVSTGARAVYDSRKRFYKALGLSRDEQHKRALKDAAVAYNETQQSAQGAYLSILQKEGGFKAMVMTLYRNSQMAYSRKVTGSMAELYKKAVRWKDILDNEEKKYLEMGLSEEDAKKEANKALLKSAGKDVATLVMFGYVLNMVWYLGEQLPYLLFGDDEEEKEKIMDMSLKIGATGMFEGFALGNVAKDLYVKGVTGNRYSSDMFTTPFASDAEKIINRFANDGTLAGMSQLLILGAETATGISPQRLIDDVAAVIDFCNGDLDKATEVTLLTTRLAKVPQSQIDKLYLEEALGGDVVALAERYAEYKRLRDYPLNIGDDKILKKYAERFKKAHNEDLKEIVRDENAYEGYFSNASPEEKIKLAGYRGEYLEELTGKKAEEVLTGRELVYYTLYGRKEQNLVYSAMTTPDDVDDEICIEMMMSELKPIQDEYMKVEDWKAYKKLHEKELGMYEDLERIESDISYEKSKMKENPVYAEEGMTKIRTLRAEAVELINKYRNE